MATEYGSGKSFRVVKIFHIIFLIAVLLYADILYRWPVTDGVSWGMGLNHSVLKALTISLVILAIYGLVAGYFIYRIIMKTKKINTPRLNNIIFPFYKNFSPAEKVASFAHEMLAVMSVAIAIFGLVLGMLGDGWQVTVPFFVVAEIVLIITFPTQKRWQQLLAKITEPSNGQR